MSFDTQSTNKVEVSENVGYEPASYVFENSEELYEAVRHTQKFTQKFGDISTWNTKNVTSMKRLFKVKDTYYVDMSKWDISGWDVGNVKDMT